MDERLMQLLFDKNKARVNELMEHLATGAAKTYDEYKEVVGVIRGLLQANQNIEDLVDRIKESEDE